MRYSDWQSRFATYHNAVSSQPFVWGEHDCALFACNSIKVITGIDPAEWFRGKYSDESGAYAALTDFAGGGLEETAQKICDSLGFPEVPPLFAQRGDVVLVGEGNAATLGVVDLTGRYVMIAAKHGVVRQPLSCVRRSWRVE